MKPILILHTGDVPPDVPHTGNFDDLFLRMADYSRTGAVVVHAVREALPEDASAFSGIVVTGSPAMVSDREPWSERCAVWLRGAVLSGAHVLGVCYGHQLIAHAFGGTVGYHPQGMELGTHDIRLRPEAEGCPLFAGLPGTFRANLAHSQTVLAMPEAARALARSDHDPHQILLYGERAVTFQFHPEFDDAVMQTYVDALAREGAEGGKSAVRLGVPVERTPVAAMLLQRFVHAASGSETIRRA
jgi:GMP synthase (glutamine-hydrolysing)